MMTVSSFDENGNKVFWNEEEKMWEYEDGTQYDSGDKR